MTEPYVSDGCSGGMSWFWRKVLRSEPPWEGCCFTHDLAYRTGGTRKERSLADLAMLVCVATNGHPIWAFVMWVAVRVGGHPLWPTPYRWGFGCKYPHLYTKGT